MSPIKAVEKAVAEASTIEKTFTMCKRFKTMLGEELTNQLVYCNRLRGAEKVTINGTYMDKHDFCDRILLINYFYSKSSFISHTAKFVEKVAVDSAKSIRKWCYNKIKRLRSNSI